jgi:Ni/Co efflux regulator RcnB
MNRESFLSAAMALMLVATTSAFAQGNSRKRIINDCPDGPGRCQGQASQPGNQARQPMPQRNQINRNQRPQPQTMRQERGAGPEHAYRQGDRLPSQYRSHQYVVEDWRGHHLIAPPRGYHWVQTGADYVLVAIATGIILQLMLGY